MALGRWAGVLAVKGLVVVALVLLAPRSAAMAQEALPAPTLAGLCRVLREGASGPSRCRVVRRAGAGRVRAAALMVSDERHDELWIAAREAGGWRVVRGAGTAYSYQELRGRLALRSLRVHALFPGGPPEIDAVVSRSQATVEPPEACYFRAVPETHRYVCARDDGEWACLGLQVRAGEGATIAERGCAAPAWAPPAPWSVELRFTQDELEVIHTGGRLPGMLEAWVGSHPLRDVLRPRGEPPPLPTPPDTI